VPLVLQQAQIAATGVVVLNHNLENLIVYASTNGSAVRLPHASAVLLQRQVLLRPSFLARFPILPGRSMLQD
jgi:hypothetical protein